MSSKYEWKLRCPKCGGNIVATSGDFGGFYSGRWFCEGCGEDGITEKYPAEPGKPEWSQLSKAKRRARRLAEAWAKYWEAKGIFHSDKTEHAPDEMERMDREIAHFQKTHAPGTRQRNE